MAPLVLLVVLVLVLVLGSERQKGREPPCSANWITRNLKFVDDARGSATECAAWLRTLVAKRVCTEERIEHGKSLLVRVVSMLSKLVDRFSPVTQVREDRVR